MSEIINYNAEMLILNFKTCHNDTKKEQEISSSSLKSENIFNSYLLSTNPFNVSTSEPPSKFPVTVMDLF